MGEYTYIVRGTLDVVETVTIDTEDESLAMEQAGEQFDPHRLDGAEINWDEAELEEALDDEGEDDDDLVNEEDDS